MDSAASAFLQWVDGAVRGIAPLPLNESSAEVAFIKSAIKRPTLNWLRVRLNCCYGDKNHINRNNNCYYYYNSAIRMKNKMLLLLWWICSNEGCCVFLFGLLVCQPSTDFSDPWWRRRRMLETSPQIGSWGVRGYQIRIQDQVSFRRESLFREWCPCQGVPPCYIW